MDRVCSMHVAWQSGEKEGDEMSEELLSMIIFIQHAECLLARNLGRKGVCSSSRLLGNPDSSHTHTSANAHRRDTDLLARPPQLRQQRANLPSTGHTQRVTESNSTTLGVHLLEGDTQLLDAIDALGGKRLVDLPDIDIIVLEARLLHDDRDGGRGADAHEERGDTDDAGLDELADDGLAEALGGAALHQQDGGGTVGDLAGVAGVDAAVLCERSADLAERLGRDALADAVIAGNGNLLLLLRLGIRPLGLNRRNLLIEETSLLRLNGLGIRRRSEDILLGARDALRLRHLLRQHAHGHLAISRLLVRLEVLGELRHGVGAIVQRHALRARADADLDHTRADGVCNVDAGLQARGALAVETLCGRGDGEAGGEGGGAELGCATAGGQDGADGDVLDEGGVDAGLRDHGFEDSG